LRRELEEKNQEIEELSELKQVYQDQQEIIVSLSQENADLKEKVIQLESQGKCVHPDGQRNPLNLSQAECEQLVSENQKLKMQLGDLIEKYKILFSKIKEIRWFNSMQAEKLVQQVDNKFRDQSINPFSIASASARVPPAEP
jgi:predicted RNase H-like nuclease (RuvC/YqgF family)